MKTPLNLLKITRRQLLSSLVMMPIISLLGCANAQDPSLQTVHNLQQLSREATTHNLPIMLFVTSPGCGYCHILERDVIIPMLKNPHYADKVFARRLDLGLNAMVDIDGQTKDPMKVAARYKAQLTPTIVFLSPEGDIIQDHILGVVKDIDQYGGMIDHRLNLSLEKLNNPKRIDHTR